MRVLEMAGVVDANEMYYDGWEAVNIEGPTIGGQYVIEALHETFPETGLSAERAPLTVLLAHGGDQTMYRGTAWACEGDGGYSSLTPGSGPDMWVGGGSDGRHLDLLERLHALDGETVMLRIDDGPPLPSSIAHTTAHTEPPEPA